MRLTALSICGRPLRSKGNGGDAGGTVIKEGRWRWIACGNRDGMGIGDTTLMTSACVGNKGGMLLVP